MKVIFMITLALAPANRFKRFDLALDIYPPRERGDFASRGSRRMLRVITDTSRPLRDIGTFVTCVGGFGEGFRGSLPKARPALG